MVLALERYASWSDWTGSIKDALYKAGACDEFELKSQYEFCLNHGLKKDHRFLDLGCGCLRGTARLVDYLDDGNFHGADISAGLLAQASPRLEYLGIGKKPTLSLLENYDLKDRIPLSDFILSVSLLTHVLPEDIGDLFRGVSGILNPQGVWYFTIYPVVGSNYSGNVDLMFYKKEWLADRGKEAGLKIEELNEGNFPNPAPGRHVIHRVNSTLGQWVMKATR